jgi:c-di-GMP-related signal transduction protein
VPRAPGDGAARPRVPADRTDHADRIETERESDALRRVGIEFGQGFLFGHPTPVDELASH